MLQLLQVLLVFLSIIYYGVKKKSLLILCLIKSIFFYCILNFISLSSFSYIFNYFKIYKFSFFVKKNKRKNTNINFTSISLVTSGKRFFSSSTNKINSKSFDLNYFNLNNKPNQCKAIIKSKKSKFYNSRCTYNAKFDSFCGKHKNYNLVINIKQTNLKQKCIGLNKKGSKCCRLVVSGHYCFQHKKKIFSTFNKAYNKDSRLLKTTMFKFTDKPIKPFLKWVGGKQDLLCIMGTIIPKLMNNYHEPFLGGGSVLLYMLYLHKHNKILIKGKIYAYDLNKDLINLYCTIQKNPDLLYAYLVYYASEYSKQSTIEVKKAYYYTVREQYNKLKFNNVERAAIFIFLNKTCFRGMYRVGPNGFNVPFGNYNNPSITFNRETLTSLNFFIKDVIFKHCDFEQAFQDFKKGDFVYLDPPYMPEKHNSFLSYTNNKFSINKHIKLFCLIKALSNNSVLFLMSNSKVDFVLKFFKAFCIKEVLAKRRINAKTPDSKKIEVLVYNNLNRPKSSRTHMSSKIFTSLQSGYTFEKNTSLRSYYDIKTTVNNKYQKYEVIVFKGTTFEFVYSKKAWFRKYMLKHGFVNKDISLAHGCKQPDAVFCTTSHIFIIEKKKQSQHGSTVEKLQSAVFKREHYSKLYPKHKIEYIFLLSFWFKANCSLEVKWLNENNIPVFYASDKGWELSLIHYMLKFL